MSLLHVHMQSVKEQLLVMLLFYAACLFPFGVKNEDATFDLGHVILTDIPR